MLQIQSFPIRTAMLLCLALCLMTTHGYSAEPEEERGWITYNWARMRRAGFPQCIAPWAMRQRQKDYKGYYVGGGATFFGDERCPHEGTWGWDYAPRFSRVRLKWFHGRKYQSGEGQYDTDRRNVPVQRFQWLRAR